MCEGNQTEIVEFILLGFPYIQNCKILLFTVILISYLVILNGNLLIIMVISVNEQLKIPMFFFLKHLAIADLLLTSTIVPMMLDIILMEGLKISVHACICQLHVFTVFGIVQCFLIAVMSYDRYVAICNPMRYNSIMDPQICLQMVLGSWFLILFGSSGEILLVYQLYFCGGNIIDHFFCDSGPLIGLSTSDTSLFAIVDLTLSVLVIFVPFVFIIVTYVLIIIKIIKMSSSHGRWKAFYTCSSHLATVCTYYGSLMTVYMTPTDERSVNTNKFMSLFYIIATPFVNPIIYSLRNHKIWQSLETTFINSKKLRLG